MLKDQISEAKINEWKKLILNNYKRLVEEKQVIEKYGKMFNPANLNKLTKEDFKSFLLFKNNRHWEAVHRQGNMITSDMDKLKQGLAVLLDESKNIRDRLNFLFPKNKTNYIKGLGRAIITPILLVVYPQKYGVWNSKSEAGLKKLDLFPRFSSKDSFADKYIQINQALNDLSNQYQLSLWQVDEIFGWIMLGNPPITPNEEDLSDSADEEQLEKYEYFGLESHLEDFLIENWDRLELGKKYSILEEDGDIVGQQFITDVGRIDILAKSKDDKEWLVIELKKGRSGDQVVGQILRYMGWLKKEKLQANESIKGLIILGEEDEKLKYAISSLPDISVMTYQVSFQLQSVAKTVFNKNNLIH